MITYKIQVHTRARKPRIVETDSILHIYISEPPVDGKANKAVLKALAKHLKIGVSRLSIVAGAKSKNKKIKVL